MNTLFKSALSVAVTLALGGGLTGCLNDDAHDEALQIQNAGMIAEIPSSAFYGVTDNEGLPIQATPVSLTFSVNVASPAPPTQDVTFTLGVDPAALDAYNKAHDTDYQVLPTALYQIPNLTVTVPAGQRMASVAVNLFTDRTRVPDPGLYNDASYALPLTIKSVSPSNVAVSGNFGSKIYVLKIKNQYDGNYLATGTFTHPVNGPRAINEHKELVTVDLQTVETDFADLGGSGWRMQLRVNADNTVTLIPTGAANKATQQTGVNKYDPATRTYTLNYFYPGGGGNRVITETLTFEN